MTAPFDHVLLAVAEAEDVDRTVDTVVAIARAFSSRVTLIHARERKIGPRDEVREQESLDDAHRYGAAVAARLDAASVRAELVVESVHPEKLSDLILAYAAAVRADLIVIGGHHAHNLRENVFGDIGKQLVHRAHCPVLLMPSVRADDGPSETEHAAHA